MSVNTEEKETLIPLSDHKYSMNLIISGVKNDEKVRRFDYLVPTCVIFVVSMLFYILLFLRKKMRIFFNHQCMWTGNNFNFS